MNTDELLEIANDYKNDMQSALWDYGSIIEQAAEHIKKLERALEIYSEERKRFAHATPEMTGMYFLAGGFGETDRNLLPEYVRICPAYGADWTQTYKKVTNE